MSNASITKREAAEILGVDPSTVGRMVKAGTLKPHRTIEGPTRAAMYLFTRASVERLRRKREQDAA